MKLWIIAVIIAALGISAFLTYFMYSYYNRPSAQINITEANKEKQEDSCECEPCPENTKAVWDEQSENCCGYECKPEENN